MAGARQPTKLLIAKGNKHFTKAEIEERLSSEPQPCTDDLTAPSYLTAAERTRFAKIAGQLDKLKVMGETDTETLARYITAQSQYEKVTKELRALLKKSPDSKSDTYMAELDAWTGAQERLAKLQDRYFKQAQTAAASLGLTISSRCKLVVPKTEEAPKQNKFGRFKGEARRA